jgi:hypothetical protein
MSADLSPEYIDHTVFLGMNAAEPSVRFACKGLLVARLERRLFMTWDHVGRCDDIIWGHDRALQDRYYPFMDALHSRPFLMREGYQDSTLHLAGADRRLVSLPVLQRLLVARAIEQGAVIYTIDPILAGRSELPVRSPPGCAQELAFPPLLEALYQDSLGLRLASLGGGTTPCTAG